MPYLTEGDLENHILQDIDSTYSAWITSVIAMVTQWVNTYTGTNFENSASSDRYFDGSGECELVVGDFQSISQVLVLDSDGNTLNTMVADTDYFTTPYNETVKNCIEVSPSGQLSRWPRRRRAVKVTGVWGYSTIPADVKLAAIRLAAHVINEGLRGGRVSSENLGSYQINYQQLDEAADVLGIYAILDRYRVMNFSSI